MKMKNQPEEVFDRTKKPVRQNIFLLPFIWLICNVISKWRGLKIKRINMKGLKPPFLVLATHHGFIDFVVTPRVLFPYRANYISELEGFEAYGEQFYRHLGCLCKRKFTNDLHLIRNIKYVVSHNKDIIVIYPEARYCNVGTHSTLPESMGKLAKLLKVPVVILKMRGNYLMSPIWNLKTRRVHLEADLTQILTADDLLHLSAEKINAVIAEHFQYDDYKWQRENRIEITYKKRAEGIHKPLYKCPHCQTEYQMDSKDHYIFCGKCHKTWEMTVFGEMKAVEGETEFSHIPDWYEWERNCVIDEISKDLYLSEAPVQVEALPGAKGFIHLGKGYVKHNKDGYILKLIENGINKAYSFKPIEMTSVHTEYDYRGKGECITLSTLDNTYFLYPLAKDFNVTKVQFATEELYRLASLKHTAAPKESAL